MTFLTPVGPAACTDGSPCEVHPARAMVSETTRYGDFQSKEEANIADGAFVGLLLAKIGDE